MAGIISVRRVNPFLFLDVVKSIYIVDMMWMENIKAEQI